MFFGLVQIGSLIFSCVCLLDFCHNLWHFPDFALETLKFQENLDILYVFQVANVWWLWGQKAWHIQKCSNSFIVLVLSFFSEKIVEKTKTKNNLEWKNACNFSMYTSWAQHKFSNLIDFHGFPTVAWKKTKNAGLNCLNSFKPAKVVGDSLPQG